MKKDFDLLVYGCGGHARSIINTALEKYSPQKILLVDDNVKEKEYILGCRTLANWNNQEKIPFIVAVGDNERRQALFMQKCLNGEKPVSIISETASIGINTIIESGSFVAKKVCLGPEVRVGRNSIVNTGSIIDHETNIGINTHIAPGTTICGRCRIGDNVFIGAGCVIKDNIKIGDNVIIGAGAVVIRDIVESGVYVGVPARKIEEGVKIC